MTRRPFQTCDDCGTVKWPVRGIGRVCPKCDALGAWPVIMANYRPTSGPWAIVRDPDRCPDCGEDILRNDPHAPGCPRVDRDRPATELQRDVDEIIRDTPYDWEREGF